MIRPWCRVICWLVSWMIFASSARAADNVIVVTLDGFRWQELFGGADETLINKEFGGVTNVPTLKQKYWRDTPEARREALMPFFWSEIAKRGQVFGDPERKAASQITNGKKFSYPGYNELFVGFPDPKITSNTPNPNENINVFEFLQRQSQFSGRVAAYATWDVMLAILNQKRSGIFMAAGWAPIVDEPLTAGQKQINDLQSRLPVYWKDNVYDVVTMHGAREHLLKHRPRVLYIGLGETDEWAHGRRYDLYLDAAHNADKYLAELWQQVQSLPEYTNKTALLITTDHGRGLTGKDWTSHGADIVGAEFIWIGVLGADVPALGIRSDIATTQAQIAATVAHLVGQDFRSISPKAAAPLKLEK